MGRTLVGIVYHNADLDGKGSAAVVANNQSRDVQVIYHGVNYKKPGEETEQMEEVILSKMYKCEKVYVVDFHLTRQTMNILQSKNQLIWIDHHHTAIESLPDHYTGLRRVGVGAVKLCCEYFGCPEVVGYSPIVELLSQYDVYDKTGENHPYTWEEVLQFQWGMRALYPEIENIIPLLSIWKEDDLNRFLESTKRTGRVILDYQKNQDRIKARNCFEVEFEGYKGIAGNNMMNSLAFDSVYNPEQHDLMISFTYTQDRRWRVGLFTTNQEIDCGIIARRYGGGGHAGAAGFVVNDLPF